MDTVPPCPPSASRRRRGQARHASRRALLFLALALPALAACGDKQGVTEPEIEGLVVREVILRGDDGSVAFSHIDHWHGAPVVRAGGTRGLVLHFTSDRLAPDDHDAPPVEGWFTLANAPAEYNVRVVIEDTTVARWSGDRVNGTLHGLRDGASRLSVVVRRGTTTIHEAPPLNFRVQPAIP
jgi:hypothetical protein